MKCPFSGIQGRLLLFGKGDPWGGQGDAIGLGVEVFDDLLSCDGQKPWSDGFYMIFFATVIHQVLTSCQHLCTLWLSKNPNLQLLHLHKSE